MLKKNQNQTNKHNITQMTTTETWTLVWYNSFEIVYVTYVLTPLRSRL